MTVVRQFHERFGLPHPDHPTLPQDPEVIRARMRRIREEYEETMDELARLLYAQTFPEAWEILGLLLKELCDLRYSVEGTAVTLGLPIDDAYLEVHRSNMTKSGTEEGGEKIAKGPNYDPADMSKYVLPIIEGSVAE